MYLQFETLIYKTPNIEFWSQIFAFWEGHFYYFQVLKTNFLHFLKVVLEVLELFKSVLGIASLKNQYNRMSFTFSENYVFLKQFSIGTFFDKFFAEN